MNKQEIIHAMELSAIAYKDTQPRYPSQTIIAVDSKAGVQCFVRKYGGTLSITFRGSDSRTDWRTNLTFRKMTVPYGNTASAIRVHTGFLNAYKDPGVRDILQRQVTKDVYRIRIAGHSYGAALAVLCAVDLEYNFPEKDIEVFLFGCPRIGNGAFCKSYDKRVFKSIRVENGNDAVTKLPPAIFGYRHVGTKLHVGAPRLPLIYSGTDHSLPSYYSAMLTKLLP